MRKILNIVLLILIVLGNANYSHAQTPSSAAGFGSLGARMVGNEGLTKVYENQIYRQKKEDVTKCAPYNKYKPVENCFLCPIFSTMFNTINAITDKAITSYSSSVARVVIVAFAIWLALLVLRFVSSIEIKDLKDLVQAIITQGFMVALVVLILETGVANFFNTFAKPIYLTGQNAAQVVFTHTETNVATSQMSMLKEYKNGFDPEIGRSIIKTMTTIENAVVKFRALGESFMCYSFTKKVAIIFFPHPMYFLTGAILWIFATVLIVALPFLMIDSVFQLGVVGALMPSAVGAAAFKYTRGKYTKPVWETFLNSMFAFVFISIVVLLLLGVLKQVLTENMGGLSQSLGTAAQTELATNGGTTENPTAADATTGGLEDTYVKSLAQKHKQSFVKHEGAKLNVYLDYKGYPTVGIGHLLFREGSFDAWYRDKIDGMEFIQNGKTLSATESKNLLQKLYNSCVAKGHTNKQMKVKGEMTNVKVWGCDASIIQGLQISQSQMDKTFEKDFSIAYKKTAKNSNCNSSNAEDIWKTFNRGNAGHCGKSSTGNSSGGAAAATVSMDTTNFDLMFTSSSESFAYFEDMLKTFNWRDWRFIKLIFVFVLIWSVMSMAKEFAGEMAGAISNTAIGASIGTMAASSVKGMTVKVGKPMAEAAERQVDRSVRYAGRWTKNKVGEAYVWAKMQVSKRKMDKSADGTYTDRKGFKHKMSEDGKTEIITRENNIGNATMHQEANGNIRYTQRKEKIERTRNEIMTIEVKTIIEVVTIKDRDGKQIGNPEEKIVSIEQKESFHSVSAKDIMERDGKANEKTMAKLDKLVESAKTPEEKQRIQRAIMKKIHEQRFSKGMYDKKMQKQPELVSDKTVDGIREITYKIVTAKGEIVIQTTRFRPSGQIETHQDIIKGNKITRLSSDGLRNREVTAELKNTNGVAEAKTAEDIDALIENNAKEGSVKTRYSYSKFAQNKIDHGVDPRDIGFDEEGNQTGMMSWDEAVGIGNLFEEFVESKGHEFEKAKIKTDIIC